mgnify:CR=1 FL=1
MASKALPGRKAVVHVYPNPVAHGELTITYTDLAPGKYQVALLTAAGNSAVNKTIQVAAKGQVERMSTQHLSKGWYVLRISDATQQVAFTQKLLIQ